MKYALVTGSTKGIGKAIGISLLKVGYYVFFNYANDDDEANALKLEIGEYKNMFSIIKANISKKDDVEKLCSIVLNNSTQLDCLIHNAGIMGSKKNFPDIPLEDWEISMNIHVNMPFFITQMLNNHIAYNGRIIFIGTILGLMPHAMSIAYSVSKAAEIMLAKSLVKIFKDRKITVNIIAPGFIDTPYQKSKDYEHRKRIENKIALGRFGYPEEVAAICMNIIDNQYINGAIVRIDGGYDME